MSPATRVQLMQALVARALVDEFGLSERRAAALLGVVPSSVSQYRSGKRLGSAVARSVDSDRDRRVARQTAQRLVAGADPGRTVLEAALSLSATGGDASTDSTIAAGRRTAIVRELRRRVAGEQQAVTECMRLAQRARDELTRALFRQIASDSLRHAEIAGSIASFLDRGIGSVAPSGVTRADVERLIQREHAAEATGTTDLKSQLGGLMRILWESMEADEAKHDRLLTLVLAAGKADGEEPTGAPSSRPRA